MTSPSKDSLLPNSSAPLDEETAYRLAHAASRATTNNLFRLLVEMAPPTPEVPELNPADEDDLGPPWDDDGAQAGGQPGLRRSSQN